MLILVYVLIYLVVGVGVILFISKVGRENCTTFATESDMVSKENDREFDAQVDNKGRVKVVAKVFWTALLTVIAWPVIAILLMIMLTITIMRE